VLGVLDNVASDSLEMISHKMDPIRSDRTRTLHPKVSLIGPIVETQLIGYLNFLWVIGLHLLLIF
jgi:hypothetical protein